MGRPALPEDKKRIHLIWTAATESQVAEVQAAAKRAGKSISTYTLECLLYCTRVQHDLPSLAAWKQTEQAEANYASLFAVSPYPPKV